MFRPAPHTASTHREGHPVVWQQSEEVVGWVSLFRPKPAQLLKIAHLHGNTQTVGIPPVLLYKGTIGFGQHVHTNQFSFVFGNS